MGKFIAACFAGLFALFAVHPAQARTVVIESGRGGYGYHRGCGTACAIDAVALGTAIGADAAGGYGYPAYASAYPAYAPAYAAAYQGDYGYAPAIRTAPVSVGGDPRRIRIVQALRAACRAGDAPSCQRLRAAAQRSAAYADDGAYGDDYGYQDGYQDGYQPTPAVPAYGGYPSYGAGYGYGSEYGSGYGSSYGNTPQTTVVIAGGNGSGYTNRSGYGSNQGYGSSQSYSQNYGSGQSYSSNYGSSQSQSYSQGSGSYGRTTGYGSYGRTTGYGSYGRTTGYGSNGSGSSSHYGSSSSQSWHMGGGSGGSGGYHGGGGSGGFHGGGSGGGHWGRR